MKKTTLKNTSSAINRENKKIEQKLEELAKAEKKIDSIFQFPREAMMKHFSK